MAEKLKTVGSVCSGIEAASVAWLPLGLDFRWFSEIAPFPSRFLSLKYPGIVNLGDMSNIADNIRNGTVETCDIICAGTPCQAFSFAGWQKGLTDDRGNLTLKFVDIVNANDDVRISNGENRCITFWENVEGVLSDKTNAFGCLISSLAGLSDVLTVKGTKWPSAGYLRGPKRTVVWRVLDAKYFGLPQQRKRLYLIAGSESLHPENILFEQKSSSISCLEYDVSKESFEFSKDDNDFEVFRSYTDCLYSSYATKWNGNAAAYNGSLFVVQNGRIRRLSPLECERLMGFPDNYTAIPDAKKSNRYNSIGNSWAIPVIKWIGERMLGNTSNSASDWFLVKSKANYEFYDLSKGFRLDNIDMNSSEMPENVVLGNMKDVVSGDAPEDIYLSPVGCAGILRRTEERKMTINSRLRAVLQKCAYTMPLDEIEKKSRIQKRGRLSS